MTTEKNALEHAVEKETPQPFPILVMMCGIATSVVALALVYGLSRFADVAPMGWYVFRVIPAGSIMVGIIASCGYGFASWFSGFKITRHLLWMMLALQSAVYFGGEYLEFKELNLENRASNRPVTFIEYYDIAARSIAWRQKDGSAGEPLGGWGYFFKFLQALGFAAGGLIMPTLMHKWPYCTSCKRYMRNKPLALIPAGPPRQDLPKRDSTETAIPVAKINSVLVEGKVTLQLLQEAARQSQFESFEAITKELQTRNRETSKLPMRYSVDLVHCEGCNSGSLVTMLWLEGPNHLDRRDVESLPVSKGFVRRFTAK